MPHTHQVTCAGEDCPEWSITSSLQPITRQLLASAHRAQLAAEGWSDVEGRDYCPSCAPTGATR
ncbi:hypothetical protein [Streptomyces sp.]|uniref:hypothetical protein n=1 Tax=Streptomyces sp. TaxID=1931 RepID=UPI002D5A7C1E|nr:hypothetical protein [Streptomyces sp.]HZF92040.1 hypothetical protein [Streptomyces sp.]